jgi:hypothetical protein
MLFNRRFNHANPSNLNTSVARKRRVARSRRPEIEGLEGRQLQTGLLLISNVNTTEGTGGTHEVDFNVTLAAPVNVPVSVHYETGDRTATAGADYVATSGDLTFAPGEMSKSIPVTIIGDSQAELTESFFMVLSAPTNAIVITPASLGFGTILDDDVAVAPKLSIGDVSMLRGFDGAVSTMNFNVSLNTPAITNISVTATTSNVTAIAGVDYQANSQVLTFAPGEMTKQFPVTIYGKTATTSDKLFVVNLSGSSAQIVRATGAGIIRFGDSGTTTSPTPVTDLQLSVGDAVMTRGLSGSKTMNFKVSLNGASDAPVTVTAATSNVTALAGVDYQAKTQDITFAPGETVKQFSVTIYGTSTLCADKLFLVTLSNTDTTIYRKTGAGIIRFGA